MTRKALIGIFALVATVHAADISGTWSGPAVMKHGDETRDDSAYLVLKQAGNTISGTVGPNQEKQLPITKGTIEGNAIYIEAVVEGENKLVLRLKLDEGKLIGELKAEGPNPPPVSGKMTLSKDN